jgi:hypothetical protein
LRTQQPEQTRHEQHHARGDARIVPCRPRINIRDGYTDDDRNDQQAPMPSSELVSGALCRDRLRGAKAGEGFFLGSRSRAAVTASLFDGIREMLPGLFKDGGVEDTALSQGAIQPL